MKTPWPILTLAQMRGAEAALFAAGMDEYALMVRAGEAAAEIIWRAGARKDTLVLCGPGNNGGDGYVIARVLRDHGVAVRVAASAPPATPSAQRACADWGGAVEDVMCAAPAEQVVDALFGIGLTRGLDAQLAGRLADLVAAADLSHAIDVPSGVAGDSGELLSPVPRFDICIATGALKPAHLLRPAAGCFARLVCCDIGVDVTGAPMHRLDRPRLAAPADDAHKYTRGLVAVVAGAMAGASALAAQAAARGGAGYVRMVGAQAIVDLPHAIVRASMRDEAALGDARIACLLIGPGLGRDARALENLVAAMGHGHAAVLDADALWHLSDTGFGILPDRAILTPHAGEFARLFRDVTGTPIERASAAARASGTVVILKGPVSVIAAPDGRVAVADRGPSWLSSAGTGDILAGLCAARLAVGGDPFTAAREAVWLHIDAARRAGPAFIADDMLRNIGAAIEACL